jgi:hypothetical protein
MECHRNFQLREQSKMQCRRESRCNFNSLLLIAISFLSLFVAHSNCNAEVVDQIVFREITNNYLGFSLSNKQQKVLKPALTRPLTFWPSCTSDIESKCAKKEIEQKLQKAIVRHENLKIEFSKNNPQLKIIFADQQVIEKKLQDMLGQTVGYFQDSGDSQCSLYYELDGVFISHAVILVSLDASDFKQRTCVANQFLQSIGLSLADNKSFNELWNAKLNPLSNLSEAELATLVHAASIYTYIHMCEDIVGGMSKLEVVATLAKDKCWNGLAVK